MLKEKTTIKNYYQNVDKKIKMIPLTFDPVFKGVFENNLELLKKFTITVLDLGIKPDDCKITLLDKELVKENKSEYQKTIDIYILLNETIYIDLEINRSSFEKVKLRNYLYGSKLYSMLLEAGNNAQELKNKCFYQLNLNTEDKTNPYGEDVIVPFGLTSQKIYIDNHYTVLKYLEFYRELYYTKGESLSESEIWLASLTAKNFTELDEMLANVLSLKDRKKLIGAAIRMSKDYFSIHEWEKEKCDELVRLESKRVDREEGFQEGIQKGIEQTIKNMIKKEMSLEDISEITGKSIEEITQIQKKSVNKKDSINV